MVARRSGKRRRSFVNPRVCLGGRKESVLNEELGRNGQSPKRGRNHTHPPEPPAQAASRHGMAPSSLFAAARRLLRLGGRGRSWIPPSRAAASSSRSSSSEEKRPRPTSLQSTLWPLGHPGTLLVPEIELWAARPGNRFRAVELQRIVKELRRRRRPRQALEVDALPSPATSSALWLLVLVGARYVFDALTLMVIDIYNSVRSKATIANKHVIS